MVGADACVTKAWVGYPSTFSSEMSVCVCVCCRDYRWEEYPARAHYVRHPQDNSLMTYRGHRVLATLIRAYFSPIHTTAQRFIYAGSADGSVYIYGKTALTCPSVSPGPVPLARQFCSFGPPVLFLCPPSPPTPAPLPHCPPQSPQVPKLLSRGLGWHFQHISIASGYLYCSAVTVRCGFATRCNLC